MFQNKFKTVKLHTPPKKKFSCNNKKEPVFSSGNMQVTEVTTGALIFTHNSREICLSDLGYNPERLYLENSKNNDTTYGDMYLTKYDFHGNLCNQWCFVDNWYDIQMWFNDAWISMFHEFEGRTEENLKNMVDCEGLDWNIFFVPSMYGIEPEGRGITYPQRLENVGLDLEEYNKQFGYDDFNIAFNKFPEKINNNYQMKNLIFNFPFFLILRIYFYTISIDEIPSTWKNGRELHVEMIYGKNKQTLLTLTEPDLKKINYNIEPVLFNFDEEIQARFNKKDIKALLGNQDSSLVTFSLIITDRKYFISERSAIIPIVESAIMTRELQTFPTEFLEYPE